ncbi:MAG: PQQ-dependent sugar dehydrogenase [Myxococcota bacterium]|nr:PQQ-dependent sugar dehydrogenase [Myxococcota bacterium]
MTRRGLWLVLATLVAVCACRDSASRPPADLPGSASSNEVVARGLVTVEKLWPTARFKNPVDIQSDDTGHVYVVEQRGRVLRFPSTVASPAPELVLDIRDRVSFGGEMGLLGLALDPKFKTNGLVFVDYTAASPRRTVISRFRRAEGSSFKLDPSSEEVLLEIPQPYSNHNGGQIAFGPDGMLYIGVGDGGAGGDPHNHSQNPQTLLGAILRLDVTRSQNGLAYGIPADNPYAERPGDGRGEIWAIGLRNPWRFSFDPVTGLLWAGDVGQDRFEEISIVRRGENHGWRRLEGHACYDPQKGCKDPKKFTDPVVSYGREAGTSVTGGYVARDGPVPVLEGHYVFGDFSSGRIWSISAADLKNARARELVKTSLRIATFGRGPDGRILIGAFDGYLYGLGSP